jgi:hypothetical protein
MSKFHKTVGLTILLQNYRFETLQTIDFVLIYHKTTYL